MEGAVQSVSSTTSIAQIELANLTPEEQMEELFLPKELTDPETLFPRLANAKGFLMAEGGKYYGCRPEEATSLSQKLQATIHEMNQSKEHKSLDPKESVKEHKFSEKHVRDKEFKTQKTDSSETRFETRESKEKNTTEKTAEYVEKNLTEAKEMAKPFLPQTAPKVLYREAPQENRSKRQESEKKEESHSKPQARSFDKEDKSIRDPAKQPPVDKEQEKEKEKERQGFSEDQKQQKEDEQDKEKNKSAAIQKTTFEKEFINYANQDSSIMSDLLKMRVSQFDVILLFLEILKLAIKSREEERISRWQERELQLFHLQKVVENFKQQGRYQLFAGIGAGVFAIISGMLPIAGHMKGEWLQQKLSYFSKSFMNTPTDTLFKNLSKITFAMSEMQKSTGQIQNTFAESSRTFDQHMTELHKVDGDECTRTMEDIKDHWKNIENFVYQSMQMYHEAIRQLYN